MVQKSRGGKKNRSVVAGRKAKSGMKHKKKENYKKTKEKTIECCVCYEEVLDRSDNVIMCGSAKHALCGSCKMKMLETGSECPMCRSHSIPEPKSQEVDIRMTQMNELEQIAPKKIIIVAAEIQCFNGIYEEIGKDKNKMSIYRSVKTYGTKKRTWYIYRSTKYKDWVMNDNYSPNESLIIGWSSGKFIGTSDWMISGEGGWDYDRMYISVLK